MIIYLVSSSFVAGVLIVFFLVFVFGMISLWPAIKIALWLGVGITILADVYTGFSEKNGDERTKFFAIHGFFFMIIIGIHLRWINGMDKMIENINQPGIVDFLSELFFGGLVVYGLDYVIIWLMNLLTGDDHWLID